LILQARRIIIFVVGGVTHSEVRVAHQLSKKLKRDVLLGGTSIDNPATFLEKLHHLSSSDTQHHD
jgi:syntaxin-binding protein 1